MELRLSYVIFRHWNPIDGEFGNVIVLPALSSLDTPRVIANDLISSVRRVCHRIVRVATDCTPAGIRVVDVHVPVTSVIIAQPHVCTGTEHRASKLKRYLLRFCYCSLRVIDVVSIDDIPEDLKVSGECAPSLSAWSLIACP